MPDADTDVFIPLVHPKGEYEGEVISTSVGVLRHSKRGYIKINLKTNKGAVVLTLLGSGRSYWEPKIVALFDKVGVKWNYLETNGLKMADSIKRHLKVIPIKVDIYGDPDMPPRTRIT